MIQTHFRWSPASNVRSQFLSVQLQKSGRIKRIGQEAEEEPAEKTAPEEEALEWLQNNTTQEVCKDIIEDVFKDGDNSDNLNDKDSYIDNASNNSSLPEEVLDSPSISRVTDAMDDNDSDNNVVL